MNFQPVISTRPHRLAWLTSTADVPSITGRPRLIPTFSARMLRLRHLETRPNAMRHRFSALTVPQSSTMSRKKKMRLLPRLRPKCQHHLGSHNLLIHRISENTNLTYARCRKIKIAANQKVRWNNSGAYKRLQYSWMPFHKKFVSMNLTWPVKTT